MVFQTGVLRRVFKIKARFIINNMFKYGCCSFFICVFLLSGCGKRQEQDASRVYNAVSLTQADALLKGPVEGEPLAIKEYDALTEPQQEASLSVSLDSPTEKTIQLALKKLGLYNGKIDGRLGRKSKKAIKAFQASHNLVVDGKVGHKTWSLLKKALEEPA